MASEVDQKRIVDHVTRRLYIDKKRKKLGLEPMTVAINVNDLTTAAPTLHPTILLHAYLKQVLKECHLTFLRLSGASEGSSSPREIRFRVKGIFLVKKLAYFPAKTHRVELS